jgi:hypothetical protein
MKRSVKYLLMALISVAFTVPGCGTQTVPSSDVDTGDLKGGPKGRGTPALEESKPGNDQSGGAVKAAFGKAGFPYGNDERGKMLAEHLIPNRRAPGPPTGHATGPRPPSKIPVEVAIDVSIPANVAEPPRPPKEPPPAQVRPRSTPAEVPLDWDRSEPELPAKIVLPETGRARVPSVSANSPPPLPTLTKGQLGRAARSDPTAAFSIAAAAGTVVPARMTKAPFLILNLPDPFENRRAVRLQRALPENDLPLGTSSGSPTK